MRRISRNPLNIYLRNRLLDIVDHDPIKQLALVDLQLLAAVPLLDLPVDMVHEGAFVEVGVLRQYGVVVGGRVVALRYVDRGAVAWYHRSIPSTPSPLTSHVHHRLFLGVGVLIRLVVLIHQIIRKRQPGDVHVVRRVVLRRLEVIVRRRERGLPLHLEVQGHEDVFGGGGVRAVVDEDLVVGRGVGGLWGCVLRCFGGVEGRVMLPLYLRQVISKLGKFNIL